MRQYTEWYSGRLCRCAVFDAGSNAPALLRWLQGQPEPVLALRRAEDGTVTVVLAVAKEETDG